MIEFSGMGLQEWVSRGIEDMGFERPTPIQEQVIPLILEKRDVIAQAPTGTGKTCAFAIPMINNIDTSLEFIQAVILCPTRELVMQIESELKAVAKFNSAIKIISIYGGQNFERQLAGIRKRPQIIVGTTGRILDHLRRKTLKLDAMNTLILDEVDEMLDMGFREDIDQILENTPKSRQTVLFSATLPKEIVEISRIYQNNPISVKTQHEESDLPTINQYYVNVSESEKTKALVSIMRDKAYNLALVFCNSKKRVDELSSHLLEQGLNADALHGDFRQRERDKTMKRFRGGETQILVATDVAARGIDVDNIDVVFNFDIPHDEEYYIHRIGRTARANKTGDAYTFASDKQMYAIHNLERYTKNEIIKADFNKSVLENNIDRKLFYKALRIVKRADLTTHKSFLMAELEEFREKYEDAEMLDLAAALLMQVNEQHQNRSVMLSDPPALRMKKERIKGRNEESKAKEATRIRYSKKGELGQKQNDKNTRISIVDEELEERLISADSLVNNRRAEAKTKSRNREYIKSDKKAQYSPKREKESSGERYKSTQSSKKNKGNNSKDKLGYKNKERKSSQKSNTNTYKRKGKNK